MKTKNTNPVSQANAICQKECQARCCRYITVILPAPKRQCDLDEWSWFLAHENISIYFARRQWHLEVRSRCRYLSKHNLCTIYESRPSVCQDYARESCEYVGQIKHVFHFDTKEEFDRWREKRRARAKRLRKQRTRAAAKHKGSKA